MIFVAKPGPAASPPVDPYLTDQCAKAKSSYIVDLISDALPFWRLRYAGTNAVANAIGYAIHYSRSADAIIHDVLTARREFA